MGIYIKGMEMPTARDTLVLVKTNGTAIVYEDEAYVTAAVYVPPHGRLADLDKIENEIAQLSPEDYTAGGIRLVLDCVPTIIPAEESE